MAVDTGVVECLALFLYRLSVISRLVSVLNVVLWFLVLLGCRSTIAFMYLAGMVNFNFSAA